MRLFFRESLRSRAFRFFGLSVTTGFLLLMVLSRLVAQQAPDASPLATPAAQTSEATQSEADSQSSSSAPSPVPSVSPSVEVVEEIAKTAADLPVPPATPVPSPSPVAGVPAPAFSAPASAPELEIARTVPEVPPPPATPLPRTAEVAFPTPGAATDHGPAVLIGRPVGLPDYGPEGNRRAAQLRSYAPQTFNFDRAALRDVLRFLADEAGIPWIGIDEQSPAAQKLVTFRMNTSPFAALQSVARQNGIQLSYNDGVWFMVARGNQQDEDRARIEKKQAEAEKDNELVGVVYQLKHDPVDRVDFRNEGVSSGLGGGGMSSGGQGSQVTTPNMPLQYSQRVFEAKSPRIVNEIRILLGMRPLIYNKDGTVTDPEIVAGENKERGIEPLTIERAGSGTAQVAGAGTSGPGTVAGGAAGAAQGQSSTTIGGDLSRFFGSIYIPPQRPQVIYNSDSNIVWVVATRKQHRWVAEYLQRVDKPQDLIAIEVKFFETRKNPQTDFGINWENTFGKGITVRGGASMGAGTPDEPGQIGNITYNTETGSREDGTQVDYQNRGLTLDAPYSAVLSLDQVSATLQAFVRDRDSSLVQYPRVLTINNREVAITSAENTPVNAGVSQTQSGSTATQTGTLGYLPTGTQINILPKTVGKGQIALAVAVTISQIVRYEQINLGTGLNPYPVTSQRVYNAALQVDSGYTLAVGGLEKSADAKTTGGIPVLKDIPGLGYLFKNKGRVRDKSNLIIFITPYLISDPSRTPGISEHPEAVIPLRPGVPPPAPNFTPDGQLLGGDAAIPQALAWLEFQLNYFRQTNTEARDDRRSVSELRSVIERARMLTQTLRAQIDAGAGFAAQALIDASAKADSLLLELNKVLAKAQLDRFQMTEGFP